jgi:hypothetical protein
MQCLARYSAMTIILLLGTVFLGACGIMGASKMLESWEGSTWQEFNATNPQYYCYPQGGGYVHCYEGSRYIILEVNSRNEIVGWRWGIR